MVVANNFLSCNDTPFRIGTGNYREIVRSYTCSTCKVQLTADSPVMVTPSVNSMGLQFNIPNATLEFNGVQHIMDECLLDVSGGVHALDISGVITTTAAAENTVGGGELFMFFNDANDSTHQYVLAIPIRVVSDTIADDMSVKFFNSLGKITRSPPSFSSAIPSDTPLLMYRGVSLATQCTNAGPKYTYLVALKAIRMNVADYNRFRGLLANNTVYRGMRRSTTTFSVDVKSDKLKLFSYIPRLTIKPSRLAPSTHQQRNGYVPTAQVKCRPLNAARDISGNLIYVGGPGDYDTLEKQLSDAANVSKEFGEPEVTTDVSRIETILAITVGVLVGVFLISLIVYFVFMKTEKGYSYGSLLYQFAKLKSWSEAKDAVAKATGKAVTNATA